MTLAAGGLCGPPGGAGGQFGYDIRNRLTAVTHAAGGASIETLNYDPLGRLAQTVATSGATTTTTKFLYDGDRLAAEHDGSPAAYPKVEVSQRSRQAIAKSQ